MMGDVGVLILSKGNEIDTAIIDYQIFARRPPYTTLSFPGPLPASNVATILAEIPCLYHAKPNRTETNQRKAV